MHINTQLEARENVALIKCNNLSQGKENKIKGSLLGAYPISFPNFKRVNTILLCTLFTTFSASFIFSEVHKVASAKTYQGFQQKYAIFFKWIVTPCLVSIDAYKNSFKSKRKCGIDEVQQSITRQRK